MHRDFHLALLLLWATSSGPKVRIITLGPAENGRYRLELRHLNFDTYPSRTCAGPWVGPWCSIVGATVTVHQFFCILHFCHTCFLCCVELVVQFPAKGSTQVLLCLFPDVLWLRHFLYSVGPHPVSSPHTYTFVVSRAFMAGAASQAGDADFSRAPGLTYGLQGSVNVHLGALLLVPQWQCISSFVFYI